MTTLGGTIFDPSFYLWELSSSLTHIDGCIFSDETERIHVHGREVSLQLAVSVNGREVYRAAGAEKFPSRRNVETH